jgi:hypothetical protein
MAVAMKIATFWDMTSCSLVQISWRWLWRLLPSGLWRYIVWYVYQTTRRHSSEDSKRFFIYILLLECWGMFTEFFSTIISIAAGYLLGLLFSPKDGGSTFLRNVSKLLPDYISSHPRICLSIANVFQLFTIHCPFCPSCTRGISV